MSMMWRRKKSLVDPKRQIWFGLELIVVTIGFNILCAYLIFLPPTSEWFGRGDVASSLIQPLGELIFTNWVLISFAVLILLVFGILMSHRLVGPMFGLLKVIDQFKSGNRSARVFFRKYDYLVSLMNPLNDFLSLEQRRIEETDKLLKEIEENSSGETQEKAKQARAALRGS
jgi:hypothetical protein